MNIFKVVRQLLCFHNYKVVSFDKQTYHAESICMKCDKLKEEFY